jgi:diguanylate cyclase (GGDEF)-like protein
MRIVRHLKGLAPEIRAILLIAAVLLGGVGVAAPANSSGLRLNPSDSTELIGRGALYLAPNDAPPPSDPADLPAWTATLKPVPRISLFGGAYWLVVTVTNTSGEQDWVIDPNGSIIDRVDAWIIGANDVQALQMGYRADYEYLLHYGKHVTLKENATYTVALRFESPYFARFPSIRLLPRADYVRHAGVETTLILGALGALLMLGLYNFFIYARTRASSLFFYAAYMLAYAVGWGLTFNVGAQLFGFRDLHWHYVPFFLLPVLNTLFYLGFLKLDQYHPPLARVSRFNIALSLILLPSCFIALPYAHSLATLVIGLFVVTAFISGIVVWRRGFAPARFFVFAFVALLVPATFILPANVGLIPNLLGNTELWTLMGGTLDGVLLAFALAERINQLQREKDAALLELQHALTLAHTDALTQLGNRQAFERDTQQLNPDGALILVDLDGLKRTNDLRGHGRGDALLRGFADRVSALPEVASSYRLGGDEFVLLAKSSDIPALTKALEGIEQALQLEEFPEAGVSFGMATVAEANQRARLNELADARMYQHKFERRNLRNAANSV